MGARVLLTGASSFTGMWIAQALAAAGFDVVAPLLRARADYDPERLARIARVEQVAEVAYARPFGSPAFLDLIRGQTTLDALAHHAADVTGYRDPGFDAVAAFDRNLDGAAGALQAVAERGARLAVVTGTVFEAGEGDSAEPLAVTPYGLSKTLTNVALQHEAAWAGLGFGRFVIPSPYGPFEQQRSFPAYLFRSWAAGETPQVRTPLYLRDHLPGPLLGLAYAAHLAARLADAAAPEVARSSGWIATQGEFARKLAAEAAARLGRACPVAFADQTDFPEPLRRVNCDPVPREDWDEAGFWDAYVDWYARA